MTHMPGRIACLLLGLWMCSWVFSQQENAPPARTASDEIEGKTRLAESFVDVAQFLLPPPNQRVSPAAVRQTAALIEAAVRLNANEPRYPRLAAEAYAELGNADSEIAAWNAYRRLVPDDRVAQSRLIELYADRLETADKKIDYFKDLLTKPSLAPEVKAHIGALAVPLLDQRSRDAALAMLEQAAQFYPLPEVMRLRYLMLPPDATTAQRLSALLDLVKANPAQPDAVVEIGHFLSEAGLAQEGANWYSTAISMYVATGSAPSHSAFVEYLSDVYQIGQAQNAVQGVDRMLQVDPNDADAWYLKLVMGAPAMTPEMLKQARSAFLARLNAIASRILQPQSGTTRPTSRPAGEMPDIATTTARLKDLKDSSLEDAWLSALSDLAWFDLYYAKQPQEAARWIDAVKLLLPADSAVVRRFTGWSDLLSNKPAEARQHLAAAAPQDVLAALGLLRLEEQEKHAAEAEAVASQIHAQPHAGVLGAIVFDALKGRTIAPATRPAAAELQAELQKFSTDWLDVVKTPAKFYSLKAEPVRIAHRLGEPMFARVTIQNIGKYDLTIGSGTNGLIQPQLWLDAAIRGVAQQGFPGVAADRIMFRSVLRPKESITQIVRLDHRDLAQVLRQIPVGMISVEADVVTNPMPAGGEVRCAPGGQGVRFSRILSQNSEPLNSDVSRNRFFATMQAGGPSEKMLDLQLLAAYVRRYAAPDADAGAKALAGQYLAAIAGERADPAPEVGAYASYTMATLLNSTERQKTVEEMTAPSSPWESRLLGLAAARGLPADIQQKLASGLAQSDPEPIVKSFAAATLDLLTEAPSPAATQPTTAPATGASR